MVYRLQKQASVLSAKLDLLLIQNRVLQSFKRYHNLKFGLGFRFLLFALGVPEGAISLRSCPGTIYHHIISLQKMYFKAIATEFKGK